ncbi:MAG: EpsI family protein [Sphingobium sp.]
MATADLGRTEERATVMASGWPRHLIALMGLSFAILAIFARDVIDMVTIWWTSSTYSHCLFIPLLIGWLVHQRMGGLRLLAPTAWTAGLLWLAAGALLWLLGDAAGLAVLRHGGVVIMLQGAVATLLGPAVVRALLFPLFYAFFMVPVGSELEPALQLLTAKIAMLLLGFAGVPAHIDGIFITTPTGYFEVAEACSGAKFLIAMTAYGVLVCNVCFRSWLRRAFFLAGALTTCLLANGIRAFATIYMAHRTTVDAAIGFDHVVYGWFFFAFVMIVIMAAAWPFFDRRPGDQGFDPGRLEMAARQGSPLSVVAGLALVTVLAVPAWSRVSQVRSDTALMPPDLPSVPGWSPTAERPTVPWQPSFAGADHLVQGRYADAKGHIVDFAIVTYARQSEGRELIGFGQGAANAEEGWVWSSPAWSPPDGRGEIITAAGPVSRHVISFYRVGNTSVTGRAMDVKRDTMKARLLMQDQRAMAILVSAVDRGDGSADDALKAFLADLGNLEDLADAALRTR